MSKKKSIVINVIDVSDSTGWVCAASRIGEIHMKSVKSMVKNVKEKAANQKISRLNILDHGSEEFISIGNDLITVQSLSKFSAKLGELKPLFESGGTVHLQQCKIGQNRPLLLNLAKIFGVPVYAGTGAQNSLARFNLGDYVLAKPDGSFTTGVGRPW